MKTYKVVFTVDSIRHVVLIDGLDADSAKETFYDAYIQDYSGVIKLIEINKFEIGNE